MLVVRPSQMQALADAARGHFADEMVRHLQGFAPRHCAVIGEAALREAIELGCRRARERGFGCRGAVRFWIEAMFLFGSDFDRDPQWTWVASALASSGGAELERADRLHAAAMDCLASIAGPGRQHAWQALGAIQRLPFLALPREDGEFEAAAVRTLQQVHPTKAAWLGEVGLLALVRRARALAPGLGLGGERAAAVGVGCSFALGIGFGHDPLLPWIRRTLVHPLIASPELRTQRLHARLMTYLDHVLAGRPAAAGGRP